MEHAGSMASEMLGKMAGYDGECETHGKSTMYLPKFIKFEGWRCGACAEIEHREAEAKRQAAERTEWLLKVSQIPAKYRGAKFDAKTPAQRLVRATVKAFREFIANQRTWAVLALFGPVGTGKTLLASELAEALIAKLSMSVRYCTAKQMIAEIQASYGMDGKSEEGEILRFVQFDLLILDEIDLKRDTDSANLLLTEVINRRYNEEKPVVIITNHAFDSLRDFVGDRVDDRLHENAFVCDFNWPSFRRQQG
jgi:DNA replication protein DnaC